MAKKKASTADLKKHSKSTVRKKKKRLSATKLRKAYKTIAKGRK